MASPLVTKRWGRVKNDYKLIGNKLQQEEWMYTGLLTELEKQGVRGILWSDGLTLSFVREDTLRDWVREKRISADRLDELKKNLPWL